MRARGSVEDAHVERPSRRRDTLAVGLSLVIHAIVILLVILQSGAVGGSPAESDVQADVILEEAARTAAAPTQPPTQAPLPTQAPVPVRTAVPRRVAVRPLPRRGGRHDVRRPRSPTLDQQAVVLFIPGRELVAPDQGEQPGCPCFHVCAHHLIALL